MSAFVCSDQTIRGRTDELVEVPCNTTCLVAYSANAFLKGFYGVDYPICQSAGCAAVDENGDFINDAAERLGIAADGPVVTYTCDDSTFASNPAALQATRANGHPCNWYNPESMDGVVDRATQVCTALTQFGETIEADAPWAIANIRLLIALVCVGVLLLVGTGVALCVRRMHRRGQRVRDSIKLVEGATCSQFVGLLLLAFSTILLLVFMNAMQPFILSDIYFVESGELGRTTANLALADEIWSFLWLGGWGLICDKAGLRTVIMSGLAMVSLSLFLFPHAGSVYPGLLLVRLLFAQGSSALASMLTVVLASVVGRESLGPGAGLLGLASGAGALVSVFLLVGETAKALCIQFTYYIAAAVPAILFFLIAVPRLNLLPTYVEPEGPKPSFARLAAQSARAIWNSRRLQAACVSGYSARAGSIVVSSFISLWVVRFLRDSGQSCGSATGLDESVCGELLVNLDKRSCAEGFTVASRVSGMTQVFALIFAIVSGLIAARMRDPLRGLAGFAFFGVVAYGVTPAVQDPSATSVYALAAAWGIAEISMIIFAQVLVARELGTLNGVQGAVAGAYSMAGSLGIVTISYVGGWLFDLWIPQAPFVLMAIASAVTAFFALRVIYLDPVTDREDDAVVSPGEKPLKFTSGKVDEGSQQGQVGADNL